MIDTVWKSLDQFCSFSYKISKIFASPLKLFHSPEFKMTLMKGHLKNLMKEMWLKLEKSPKIPRTNCIDKDDNHIDFLLVPQHK